VAQTVGRDGPCNGLGATLIFRLLCSYRRTAPSAVVVVEFAGGTKRFQSGGTNLLKRQTSCDDICVAALWVTASSTLPKDPITPRSSDTCRLRTRTLKTY